MKTYRCLTHGESEFYDYRRANGRLDRRCKACISAKNLRSRARKRDPRVVYMKNWNASEPRKLAQRKYKDSLRNEVLDAYGRACRCCGETEILFLEVDHISNDGGKHRRGLPNGSGKFYQWLRREGFPRDNFQILCSNCNRGKFRNAGTCPHQAGPRLVVGGYLPE